MHKLIITALALLFCISALAQKDKEEYPKLKGLRSSALEMQIMPAVNKKGKWGYVDAEDHVIIRYVFDYAAPFIKEESINRCIARIRVGDKSGYLDRSGVYFILPIYDDLSSFRDGVAYFTKDNVSGFFDSNGWTVFDGVEVIRPFEEKNYAWYSSNGLWGAVEKSGKVVIAPVFTKEPVLDTYAVLWHVEEGSLKGMINYDDLRYVLPVEYEDIRVDEKNGYIFTVKNGKQGAFNLHGEEVLDNVYESIVFDETNDCFITKKDGRYGVSTPTGTKVLDNKLISPPSFSDSKAKVFYDGLPMWLYKGGVLKTAESQDLPQCADPIVISSVNSDTSPIIITSPWSVFSDEYEAGIRSEQLGSIDFDKGKNTIDTSGNISSDNNINDVSIFLNNGDKYRIGPALSVLFMTINSSKVSVFDKEYGSSLLTDWSGISFTVFGGYQMSDGVLFAFNMYIRCGYYREFVQRWYAIINESGKIVAKWQVDGNVYNLEHPASESCFNMICPDAETCFIVEDAGQLDTYLDTEKKLSYQGPGFTTTLRNSHGELKGSYTGAFLPSSVVSWGGEYLVFGAAPYFSDNEGYTHATDLSKLGKLLFSSDGKVVDSSIWGISIAWDCKIIPYGRESLALCVDNKVVYIMLATMGLPFPALRYQEAEWGDVTLRAFNYNYKPWVKKSEVYGSNMTDGPVDRAMEWRLAILSNTPDEAGLFIYRYAPYDEESSRFGYFGGGRFTQAVFEDAQQFKNGQAEVVINGKKTIITESDISSYFTATNPEEEDTVSSNGNADQFQYTAIDLGLSVKWANANLGASAPEDYGDYYAWGETETKESYSEGTYTYSVSYSRRSSILPLSADVAHKKLGGKWRMPTETEWKELIDNCTWTWTDNYKGTGKAGRIVASKIPGYTNNSIFLPAADSSPWTDLCLLGSYGSYWSSSLDTFYPYLAWALCFDLREVWMVGSARYYGYSVRPVTE